MYTTASGTVTESIDTQNHTMLQILLFCEVHASPHQSSASYETRIRLNGDSFIVWAVWHTRTIHFFASYSTTTTTTIHPFSFSCSSFFSLFFLVEWMFACFLFLCAYLCSVFFFFFHIILHCQGDTPKRPRDALSMMGCFDYSVLV